MSKKIRITESQLEYISKMIAEESQVDENIFNKITDPIKNTYYGVKGAVTGYGYNYMKDLSELKNLVQQLKQHDAQNQKIMGRITQLNNNIVNAKMRPEYKKSLMDSINGTIQNFNQYQQFLNSLFISLIPILFAGKIVIMSSPYEK